MVFERRQVKEREKEDHLYGDKDKFVTAAYKAKLAEDAKWLAEEKAREAEEAAADVTKRRDLSGFYANLLTRNAAFGGQGRGSEAATQAATQAAVPAMEKPEDKQDPPRAPPQPPKAAAMPHNSSARPDADAIIGADDAVPPLASEPHASGVMPADDVPATVSAGPVDPPSDALAAAARLAAQSAAAALVPASAGAASRSKASEDAVAQARERYLARKRQRDAEHES